MAEQQTGAGDEEPTRVTAPSYDKELPPASSPSPPVGDQPVSPPIENIDVPRGATAGAGPPAGARGTSSSVDAGTAAREADPIGSRAGDPLAPGASGASGGTEGEGDKDAGRSRGRAAADRTAEGAKVAADRVSQAASATAQALRDTDVREIARNTTSLIETARPFFLAAFAIVFTFLASVENHAAIGVVFAVGAILCVLGAAYSAAVDHILKGRSTDDR